MSCMLTRLKKSSSDKVVIHRLNEKMQVFVFCQVVQKHYLSKVKKIKQPSTAYFFHNISAKNCENQFTYVKVVAIQSWGVFWDNVYIRCFFWRYVKLKTDLKDSSFDTSEGIPQCNGAFVIRTGQHTLVIGTPYHRTVVYTASQEYTPFAHTRTQKNYHIINMWIGIYTTAQNHQCWTA